MTVPAPSHVLCTAGARAPAGSGRGLRAGAPAQQERRARGRDAQQRAAAGRWVAPCWLVSLNRDAQQRAETSWLVGWPKLPNITFLMGKEGGEGITF